VESEEERLQMDLVVIGRKEEDHVVDVDISRPGAVENGETTENKDSSNAAKDPLRSSAEHHRQTVSPLTQATIFSTRKKRKTMINDNASRSTTDMQKKVKVFDNVPPQSPKSTYLLELQTYQWKINPS